MAAGWVAAWESDVCAVVGAAASATAAGGAGELLLLDMATF